MGSLFKKPKVPKPQDPLKLAGQQSGQLLGYYQSEVPKWLQLSEQFGPQFLSQMLGQTGQFLSGTEGTPGLQALQLSAGQQAGQTLGQLRAEDLTQMTGQAGLARGLMETMSPEQAAVAKQFAAEAERARVAAQGVTPQEQRAYEQTAREGFQAAGRLGGNAAIAAEIMGREDVLTQKRAEAAKAGAQSYEAARNFYTQPGLAFLQQTPLSYQAGQQNVATAMAMGPASSGEFDYNAPLGFAQQRAGALDQYNMAKYQAKMQQRQQLLDLGIKGISLAAAPFTGGLSAGLGLSGLAGGAAGATGLSGLGLSAGMGLSSMFGGIPKAIPVG